MIQNRPNFGSTCGIDFVHYAIKEWTSKEHIMGDVIVSLDDNTHKLIIHKNGY